MPKKRYSGKENLEKKIPVGMRIQIFAKCSLSPEDSQRRGPRGEEKRGRGSPLKANREAGIPR